LRNFSKTGFQKIVRRAVRSPFGENDQERRVKKANSAELRKALLGLPDGRQIVARQTSPAW
jgi:hypothetical protein